MVKSEIKEERLGWDWLIVRGEGCQYRLVRGWEEHELIQSLSEGLCMETEELIGDNQNLHLYLRMEIMNKRTSF